MLTESAGAETAVTDVRKDQRRVYGRSDEEAPVVVVFDDPQLLLHVAMAIAVADPDPPAIVAA
jgi:hypothetical protein